MNDPSTENDTLEISKSQRKREAQELVNLAKEVISMTEKRFKKLPLDEHLRSEFEFARSLKPHGARKRQLMTVGKMLRLRDNEALLDAVNNIDQKNRQANAHFHHIEAWRDRLVGGSDQVLSELLEQVANPNVQKLRQLIRQAKKELSLEKPPAAARKLFKLLREMDEENPLPQIPED